MKTTDQERTERARIPLGVEDFRKICDGSYYYVDKTLLIRDVLDSGAETTLFTRPRRFGKTLNMNMLHTFFEKTEEDTARYFRDKKIWTCGEKYTSQQGAYPVIDVSFWNVEGLSWPMTLAAITAVFQAEFKRHRRKLDASKVDADDWQYITEFIHETPNEVKMQYSLRELARILYDYYGTKPVILIDEYDKPINAAWRYRNEDPGYYNNTINFMRGLFSGTFKGTACLSFGFVSGVLRVGKEGLYSGLNNLYANGVLSNVFDEYFGFTPDEVREMAAYYSASKKYDEIKEWYQGYRFGEQEVFNPWSVLSYFFEGCKPGAYWSKTTTVGTLADVLRRADGQFLQDLAGLGQGGPSIWSRVKDNLAYPDLEVDTGANADVAAATLLLMAGYLTTTGQRRRQKRGRDQWELVIPNKEVRESIQDEILELLPRGFQSSRSEELHAALTSGKAQEAQAALADILAGSPSFFDLSNENAYHMLLLGLLLSMPDYRVTSNREGGIGRYDLCLAPDNPRDPGVILELKVAEEKHASDEELEKLARSALSQIRAKGYVAELQAQGISRIHEYGIAFYKKNVCIASGADSS